MPIHFSPVGIAIALVFYVVAFLLLRRPLRALNAGPGARAAKWLLIVAVTLLPWAEELWIAASFRAACVDANARILRTVRVDGFLEDTNRPSPVLAKTGLLTDPGTIRWFDTDGYRFKEVMLKDGKVWKTRRTPEGVESTIVDQPEARYQYRATMEDLDMAWKVSCSERVVVDGTGGETLGSYRYCKRYPSFLEALWLQFLHQGPVDYCPPLEGGMRGMLYKHVLIPIGK
jgi:hypothetical protein